MLMFSSANGTLMSGALMVGDLLLWLQRRYPPFCGCEWNTDSISFPDHRRSLVVGSMGRVQGQAVPLATMKLFNEVT